MIFFSSGGESDKSSVQTVQTFLDNGINNIELSGGIYEESHLDKLLKLENKSNFLIHNYFPPPKEPFVFNLGSLNKSTIKKSLSHAKEAIDYASALKSPTYSFHAGFLIDPDVKELGKKIKPKELYPKKESMTVFIENVNLLSDYAYEKKIDLLVENNVLSKNNSNTFPSNPLLMTDLEDTLKIMSETPANVNLLVDLAHLKVSSNTQSFSCEEYLKKVDSWIRGYHMSDNNGLSDTNNKITNDSWFWKELNKDIEFFTIEVYGLNITEIKEQINLVQDKICQK